MQHKSFAQWAGISDRTIMRLEDKLSTNPEKLLTEKEYKKIMKKSKHMYLKL